MTGNGAFDGVTDFGESFVKLRYSPASLGTPASISALDWWTPWTDAARVRRLRALVARGNSTLDEGASAALDEKPRPTNLRTYALPSPGLDALAEPLIQAAGLGALGTHLYPLGDPGDMDLGSGGPVLVPRFKMVVGAGKDGVLYAVKAEAMGKTQPTELVNPTANYAKLAFAPIWFTFYADGVDPAPPDITSLNFLYDQRTHHQHGSPIYWESPDHGPMLFCWGENGNLRAWSLAQGGITYLACGAEVASPEAPVPAGGMPGAMMCLGADGAQPGTGVLWACVPYGDANVGPTTAGRLLAYDASTFGTFGDGSKQLRVLWDSQQWNLQFTYNKFCPPVVANGRLIVPTYDGRVDVYGP
jgi:hypothetical protein